MADLLDPTEIMFTPFEPKTQNRYIMYIEGIPAYLIKTAARPKIAFQEIVLEHMNVTRYVKGKGAWDKMSIELYDPVVPSAAQAVMEWVRLSHESVTGRDGYSDFYKKDITINVLGEYGILLNADFRLDSLTEYMFSKFILLKSLGELFSISFFTNNSKLRNSPILLSFKIFTVNVNESNSIISET